MSDRSSFALIALLLASALLHLAWFLALGLLPRPSEWDLGVDTVAVNIEQEPPPPFALPPPPPEPDPPPVVERVRVRAPEPEPEEPPPPPPPEAEAPVDFGNELLTNDGAGASWATAPTSGRSMEGPIGGPGRVTGRVRQGVPTGTRGGTGTVPTGPRLVAVADLSRRPEPPDLNGVLARNYPREAQAQGIEGEADVRARVQSDGRIGTIRVLSETFVGFGEACRRTLNGSRWSPPLDRDGHAVATEIRYKCRFEVRY